MFGIAAWNRLLKKQKEEKVVLSAHDVLGQKHIKAGLKALRLLKLSQHMEALSRDNMIDLLYTVGMNPTPDVLDGKLRLLRLQKAATFTWGELAHVWSLLLRDAANEDRILERAFAFFDKDGNGEIDVAELRTTMSELGDLLTEEEIMAFVSIMDVDSDGVIGYQEFLSTLRSEVPKFARGPAITQEDHPHHQQQQQQQQQHDLTPPSAARATLTTAAEDSFASDYPCGHVVPSTSGVRSQAGSGMQLSRSGTGAGRKNTHQSEGGIAPTPAAAAAHLNSRSSWHPADLSAEQSALKRLEQLRPAAQQGPARQSLLPAPQQQQQQQQQQHFKSQQPQSPRHQSPRPHKQLHAHYQEQLSEDVDCRHYPAASYAGSDSGSGMLQEDSLPGQAQEVEDAYDQPQLKSRSTPRTKSSLAS